MVNNFDLRHEEEEDPSVTQASSRTSTSSATLGNDIPVEPMKPSGKHPEIGAPAMKTISQPERGKAEKEGKRELKQRECYDELAFSFPKWKKWYTLVFVGALQLSMNYNTGAYAPALPQLQEEFGISAQKARVGQALFLICYAFGCELWAPFSEELGRWPILQLSIFLVNIFQIPCALAPNFATLVAFRILGGFSSAGGSVTLGIVADLYEPESQGFAVAFVVLTSVGGTIVGPLFGAFQARYLSWHWCFWIQLIIGGVVQALHFFTPETNNAVLMTRIAKKRRAKGENVYGPDELKTNRFAPRKLITIMLRPFVFFVTEPIVLCLSLLSGFSDSLIFTFQVAYGPVFSQYGFGTVAQGLAFLGIFVGYIIAYFSFWPFIRRNEAVLAKDPDGLQPEKRLYWLLFTAPCLSIGLFGFAWTSYPFLPWIAPMIFTAVVGIANYAIYMATIDYMINSYGAYSASATGGNGFARDFLAGVATFYAGPLYTNLSDTHPLQWASTLLAFLAILVTIPIYVFYIYGPQIRARSKFALTLESDRKAAHSEAKHLIKEKSRTMEA